MIKIVELLLPHVVKLFSKKEKLFSKKEKAFSKKLHTSKTTELELEKEYGVWRLKYKTVKEDKVSNGKK